MKVFIKQKKEAGIELFLKINKGGEIMKKICIVFITVNKKNAAMKIVNQLLNKKLAACINIIENIKSCYLWKGKIEKAKEVLLIIKTGKNKIEDLIKFVKKIHPYTVPEIIAYDIIKGNEDYIDWVISETTK